MPRYQIVDTAFGFAALAFDADPFRLLEVKLPQADARAVTQAFHEYSWSLDSEHPGALAIAGDLIRYFQGRPIEIPWDCMDLSRFTAAQQTVYQRVARIPYGQTASYARVASTAGFPRAARFVGTTMANNPYPILIPCHRVIRIDGSPGRFGGGSALKVRMLALEAAGLPGFSK